MSKKITIKSVDKNSSLTFTKTGVDTMSIEIHFDGSFEYEAKISGPISSFIESIDEKNSFNIDGNNFIFMKSYKGDHGYNYADSYIIKIGQYKLGRFPMSIFNAVYLMQE